VEENKQKSFSLIKSASVLIGIVIGTGIFGFPPFIAANTNHPLEYILLWVLGGFISLTGAFCYAELAARYPDTGGEYTYLKETYGRAVGFLFVWARMIIMQTGSIALIAFIFGDYITTVWPMGEYSSPLYAVLVIVSFTFLNISGTKYAQLAQVGLTFLIIFLMVVISLFAFFTEIPDNDVFQLSSFTITNIQNNLFGPALILVLLTFGGWNETSYLAGEMKNIKKNMIKTLVVGIMSITILYVLINTAFMRILGFEGIKSSKAVAYDIAEKLWGPSGSFVVVLLILICALSTLNASILTGARTNFILGTEFRLFGFMGKWDVRRNSPVQALIFQCVIALIFVALGFFSHEKIKLIVEFTAPVFWFFLILITLSVFILRLTKSASNSDFRMPFYPLPALLFLVACMYLFYASIQYTGISSLYGMSVLFVGVPVWYWMKISKK
jgi:amino acid transporter